MLLSLSLLCVSLFGFAQYPIAKDKTYKPGIYLSYEEFINNAPSMNLSYEIKERKVGYGFFGIGGNLPVNYLKIKKKEARDIGAIFGFSDGVQVYINPWKEKLSSNTRFYRVEFIRDFCYMEYLFTTKVNNSSSNEKRTMVINLETNKAFGLDKSAMKELLGNYPELLKAFEDESKKNSKLKEYLVRYLDKVESTIP